MHAVAHRLTIDPAVLDRVNAALDEIRNGRMVILVDDEDRENEGDLVLAAEHVTPEAINFMAKHGRGLICLALEEDMVDRLDLPMMRVPGRGGPPLGTAFTVSIEAASGVTTGISAADRAHTIRVAIATDVKPEDLVTPGHVFPLRARPGGVLVRTGQTEGSVDLARLAGLRGAGVICEIMKDDGTMARRPDLEVFAEEHDLLIVTVADLIQYRLQTERLVRQVDEQEVLLDRTGTRWRAVLFEMLDDDRQAVALVKGEPSGDEPLLVRVHAGAVLSDLFVSAPGMGGSMLRSSIDAIEEEGRGIVLYLEPQRSLASEFDRISSLAGPRSVPTPSPSVPEASGAQAQLLLRQFGLGAQVLADLGARKLRLLTNSQRRVVGITGYGLEIVERVALAEDESNGTGEPQR